jgi:hypothetical protein
MIATPRRPSLRVLGATGVLVLLAGLAIAILRLPEWRNRDVPNEEFFAARLRESAQRAGLTLDGSPRQHLRSKGWIHDTESMGERETAYTILGSKAADWLAREGRGPYVEAVGRGTWPGTNAAGELRVLFSLRGVPVSAIWLADDVLRATSSPANVGRDARRAALQQIFLPPGSAIVETEMAALGDTVHLAEIPRSSPPETLIAIPFGPSSTFVQRVVGSQSSWRQRFDAISVGTILTASLPRIVAGAFFYLGPFVVFVVLLAQRRIELRKGVVLAIVSVILCLADPIRTSATWLQFAEGMIAVVSKGVGLFILWSAAESWLRSTIPNFRTSLDALRAGRLGPTGGRALLAGWSIGAAAAGLWLVALSMSTMTATVEPTDGSIRLPMFSTRATPIDEGAIRTGIVLLAICVALRVPGIRRIRGSATLLAAFVLASRIPVMSYPFAFGASLVLAVVLVRAYASFGLTALLSAGMTSTVLPATIFSIVHFSWLTSESILLSAFAIAPIVFGAIGLRRDPAIEQGSFAVPAFVRRLEDESRVKYEMDLLARMQLGLLPEKTPVIDGYEIAARSILATEAGGDLYDFVPDSLGRVWIAAGDVSGHGYSCAIAQAMTKAGLASLVEAERTPAMVLGRLDRVLRGIGSPRTFTTLALLRLDPGSGDVLLSNAGHPYPWIVSNGVARELEMPSLPLGQGPEREYVDQAFTLAAGETLVLSSDGLFEGANEHGQAYGFDRISGVLAKSHRRPAAAILDAIIEDWRSLVGSAAPADDTTIVIVKRNA